MTIRVEMGTAANGAPASLDLEELLATRLLVQGNSGSGKSHLLRRLLEQSAAWVQQAIIDPEGDFATLADRFGHLVLDAAAVDDAGLRRAGESVREHRVSVVLNLEGVDQDAQLRRAASFLSGLFEAERDHWSPMLVVVDEAQLFAPAIGAGEVSDEARRLSLSAMTDLMSRGRKRGLAGVVATQRLAKLAKNVAAEASNFLMGRTFLDIDMARAADLLGMERRGAEMFRDLERGHFVALGPALSRRPLPLRIGAVATGTRGGGPRLVAPPQPAEEARDLILRAAEPDPARAPPPRRAPAAPRPDILAQLAAARPAPVHERAEEVPGAEELAERRRAMEGVLRAVLAEPDAAYRAPAVLYQDFLVRLRIARIAGPPDLPGFRRLLSLARAGVEEGTEEKPGWGEIAERAAALPEDTQGVFLLLAHAALRRAPCPPDEALARAYGTRSEGRARRMLAWLEERGEIVLRPAPGGARVVALAGTAWETAPGQPGAAAA